MGLRTAIRRRTPIRMDSAQEEEVRIRRRLKSVRRQPTFLLTASSKFTTSGSGPIRRKPDWVKLAVGSPARESTNQRIIVRSSHKQRLLIIPVAVKRRAQPVRQSHT